MASHNCIWIPLIIGLITLQLIECSITDSTSTSCRVTNQVNQQRLKRILGKNKHGKIVMVLSQVKLERFYQFKL